MLKKFCLPPWVGIEPSAFVLMLYWLSYRGLGIQLHSMRNYYQLEYTRVLYCSAHAQLEFWNLRILALQRKQPQKHPYKIASWALVWDSFWLICDKKLVDVLWQTRCCVKINHLFFFFFESGRKLEVLTCRLRKAGSAILPVLEKFSAKQALTTNHQSWKSSFRRDFADSCFVITLHLSIY